ncbi:MAG: anti-sigma factor [Myxococcota bacterium]
MNCERVEKHIGAYVDEELDAPMRIEFDDHLDGCESCRELLEFELCSREMVREALQVKAPEGLAERVSAGLAHESGVALSWRMVPAAAAAAMLIFGGAAWQASRAADEQAALEDVVRVHESGLPADVRVDDASHGRVSEFFRGRLAFPVRAAALDGHAKLVGARLSNVRDHQAAALYYDVNGRRVTVVVTDRPVVEDAEEVQVGAQRLQYRELRGHRVPVRQEAGLSYAFTGDVDRETLLRLAASPLP